MAENIQMQPIEAKAPWGDTPPMRSGRDRQPAATPPPVNIPKEHADMLATNPTADEVAQFDEVYGPNTALEVLRQKGITRVEKGSQTSGWVLSAGTWHADTSTPEQRTKQGKPETFGEMAMSQLGEPALDLLWTVPNALKSVKNSMTNVAAAAVEMGVNAVRGNEPSLSSLVSGEDNSFKLSRDHERLREPTSFIGSFVTPIAEVAANRYLLVGFGNLTRIGQAAGVAQTLTAATTEGLKWGAADQLIWQEGQETLSTMMNELPYLNRVVPDFLVTDPNDSEAVARLKSGLEGVGMGLAVDYLVPMFRSMRRARAVQMKTIPPDPAEIAKDFDELHAAIQKLNEGRYLEMPARGDSFTNTAVDGSTRPSTVPQDRVDSLTHEVIHLFDQGSKVEEVLNFTDFNFGKMQAEASSANVIEKASEQLADAIVAKKGGVQTLKEIESSAQELIRDNPDLIQVIQSSANDPDKMAKILVAAKIKMKAKADEVYRLTLQHRLDPQSVTKEQIRDAVEQLAEVQMHSKSLQTGAARATAAGRIPIGTPQHQTDEMIALIRDVFQDDKKTAQLLRGILMSPDDPDMIRKMSRGYKASEMFVEHWMNSILSGVRTHVVNNVSNALNTATLPGRIYVGGVVGKNPEARRFARNMAVGYMEMRTTIFDSLKAGWKAMKLDDNIIDPAADIMEGTRHKIGVGRPSNLAGASSSREVIEEGLVATFNGFGTFTRLPSRFLMTADEIWKGITYRASVYADAAGEAADLGLTGQARKDYIRKVYDNSFDPSGAGTNQRGQFNAREATFTRPLDDGLDAAVTTVGSRIQQLANHHPLMRLVTPFIRTPTNLMRNVWFRTPGLNRLHSQFRADLANPDAIVRATAQGKQATGAMMWAGALLLAGEGRLTGRGPRDPELRKEWIAAGNQPYSVTYSDEETGKMTSYSFSRLDPWAAILGIAADFTEISGRLSDDELANVGGAAMVAIANNVTNKTYLSGATELMNALTDPERNFGRYIQRQAVSAVVPHSNFWRQMKDDPYTREVRSMLDGFVNLFDGDLDPKRDVLGNPLKVPQYFMGKYSPIALAESVDDPVQDEIVRLGLGKASQTGFGGPPRSRTIGDVKIDFTTFKNEKGQSAHDRWWELRGQMKVYGKNLRDSLHEVMENSHYKSVQDHEKLDQISSRISEFQERAYRAMLKDFPELEEAVHVATRESRQRIERGQPVNPLTILRTN